MHRIIISTFWYPFTFAERMQLHSSKFTYKYTTGGYCLLINTYVGMWWVSQNVIPWENSALDLHEALSNENVKRYFCDQQLSHSVVSSTATLPFLSA